MMATRERETVRTWMPLLLALPLFGALLLVPTADADAAVWESEQNNCSLTIPDFGSRKWSFAKDNPDWKRYGIVKAAHRHLEKLSTGEKAKGQQAMLELAVRDAKGKDLATLFADDDIRKFFLGRFRGETETDEYDTTLIKDDWPAKVLEATGSAMNGSHGKMPCFGIYLVSVARDKVYMLRMYAFHTKYDEESLKGDLEYLAGEGFNILMPKDKNSGIVEETGPRPKLPDDAEKLPEGEPEKIFMRDYKFRMIAHGRLTRAEIDPVKEESVLVKFEGTWKRAYYRILIYAFDNSRPSPTGGTYPDVDIKDWCTKDFWKYWDAHHPEGDQWTYDWPKKTPNSTFITLPEIKEENGDVFLKGDARRPDPEDVGYNEMIKRWKVSEKVKKGFMGDKKEKSIETYRTNMRALRPGVGREFEMRLGFRSLRQTFRILVTMTNDADVHFGEAIRSTLESIVVARK